MTNQEITENTENGETARKQTGEAAALVTTQSPALPIEAELTDEEAARYEELQNIIAEGMRDFVRVGLALREIRDRKLYRQTHQCFEAFARDIYQMSKPRSYQLIAASETYAIFASASDPNKVHNCGLFDTTATSDESQKVYNCRQIDTDVISENSSPSAILPQNEAQCRALARLKDPEDRLLAWRRAVQKGLETQGRVTATLVARVVRDMKGEAVERAVNNTKKKMASRGIRMSQEMMTKFNAMLAQIQKERDAKWTDTDPLDLAKHLEMLVAVIRPIKD